MIADFVRACPAAPTQRLPPHPSPHAKIEARRPRNPCIAARLARMSPARAPPAHQKKSPASENRMSEEYEVHGPHDHAVQHAGHHDADPFAGRMAVITAVLATIGALCAYQSGNSENLALYYKNEAAIKKTEASNQWNYYQAKGEKQNLAELGEALSPGNTDAHAKFAADVDKYKQQKEPIRAKAESIEKEGR